MSTSKKIKRKENTTEWNYNLSKIIFQVRQLSLENLIFSNDVLPARSWLDRDVFLGSLPKEV